jgi:DNA-binding TFAR19-related protein (PDSD5 family)
MQSNVEVLGSTIEECYEYMLAYAAQGLPSDAGSKSGGQLRDFLDRFVHALTGLAEGWRSAVSEVDAESAKRHYAFIAVLDRDARDTLAAIELVRAQPAISSQLIDNLNASIHLRALLTDLFLLDEIHKMQRQQKQAAAADSRPRLE